MLLQLLEHIGAGSHDAVAIRLPRYPELLQHAPESRSSPATVRREVRTSEERLQVRGEPDRHRPASAARGRLHEGHVDSVDVGPLLTINLDGNEVAVQHCG